MSGKLAREIRQTKPFASAREEAALNVLRTAAVLEQSMEAALKPHGLSATQYNALRILKGAGPKGLSCQEVGARMIRLEPDLTRLFDRLEARGLLSRTRGEKDRRVVVTRIAPEGTRLLASLDGVLEGVLEQRLAALSDRKLRILIDLLEAMRGDA